MTDSEYLALAEATLDAIEQAVDDSGADIECERSGNVLTLEFETGTKIIVNLQAAMHEIWIAAKAGGFHYRHRDGQWLDTRDGSELFASLSSLASGQAGESVELAAR
ncbi:iron donor protein CyaY [Pararobbsia silviterrae]|uniref:Iron-sulfur cluster assembly protein CyaY n=1 Tax=Pararobbsia silviterrae TaxID=1792498 RepID=A0A494X4S2_9BURK|nr:iron donor protein CyaY [Pararobbsia silviterrae]RKP45707.1 iron donor protein CyaY [Pararobbsia silviterrae]